MSQYSKPSIMFLAAGTNSSSASTCFTKADIDLISGIVGFEIDINTAFGMNESCLTPLPIDIYCKFTSSELGAAKAFIS